MGLPRFMRKKQVGPDMLTIEQVSKLADTMLANDLGLLEVKGTHYAVRMVRAPGASSIPDGHSPKPAAAKALSPATGSFHPRGLDDGLPELKRGAQVLIKEPLGYIGIGPVRVLCRSPATGRIIQTVPASQETVTTGAPLFILEPNP
jgi:hypothetical protein